MFLDKLDVDFEDDPGDLYQETNQTQMESMVDERCVFRQKPRIFAIIYDSLNSLVAFLMIHYLSDVKEFCIQLQKDKSLTISSPLIGMVQDLRRDNQLQFSMESSQKGAPNQLQDDLAFLDKKENQKASIMKDDGLKKQKSKWWNKMGLCCGAESSNGQHTDLDKIPKRRDKYQEEVIKFQIQNQNFKNEFQNLGSNRNEVKRIKQENRK